MGKCDQVGGMITWPGRLLRYEHGPLQDVLVLTGQRFIYPAHAGLDKSRKRDEEFSPEGYGNKWLL